MRQWKAAGILSAIWGVWACGVGPAGYVERGNRFFDSANYDEAEINFRKAVQKDPRLGDAYFGLGRTQLRNGRPASAYENLYKAEELLPKRTDVAVALADSSLIAYIRNARASAYYDQVSAISARLLKEDAASYDGLRLQGYLAMFDRHYPAAIDDFRRADAARPAQEDVINALVTCLMENNQGGEGEKLGLDFIGKDKTFAPLYDTLYRYLMLQHRPADAEAILKSKIANNPGNIQYYLELAYHYAALKDNAGITAAVERIHSAKRFPDAAMYVGNFYDSISRPDEALQEFGAGLSAQPERKRDYQKRIAEVLMAQGRKQQATAMCKEILAGDARDFDARVMLAGIDVDSGDTDRLRSGVDQLETLARERPGDLMVTLNLGKARMVAGDAAGALASFKSVLDVIPDNVEAGLLAAAASLRTQNYRQAQKYADDVLQVAAGNPTARMTKIRSLTAVGNLNDAAAEAILLRNDFPNAAEPTLELASIRLTQKQFDEAEKLFQSLYRADPKNMQALQGIIAVLIAENQSDTAVRFLSEEAKRTGSPEIKTLLADIALRAHKLDLAAELYGQFVRERPRSAFDHMRLGDAYMQSGNIAGAVAEFQKGKSLEPNNPLASSMLALAFNTAGRYNEAEKEYREALRLDPANALVMNNLAYLIAQTGGRLEDALRMAQEAAVLQPGSDALADTVGWIYVKMKLPDEAIRVLATIVRKNPAEPAYLYHLAYARFEKGDRTSARTDLEKALIHKPRAADEPKIRELLAQVR